MTMKTKYYFPLFDFHAIFDVDFGIMSLISEKYLDTGIFDKEWFSENGTRRKMLKVLYERVDKNPLIEPGLIEEREEIDELYNSFFEDEEIYSEILNRSMPTELYNVIDYSISVVDDIDVSIVCSNKLEVELLKKYTTTSEISKVYLLSDLNKKSNTLKNKFTQIYVKNADSKILDFISDTGTHIATIYLADYKFNNEIMNNSTVITSILMEGNNVTTIDLYNRDKLNNGDNGGLQDGNQWDYL